MKRLLLVLAILAAFIFSQSLFAAESQTKKAVKGADKKGKKESTVKTSTDTPPSPPAEMKKSGSADKSADKAIGKTPDGKSVYQGSKGGRAAEGERS